MPDDDRAHRPGGPIDVLLSRMPGLSPATPIARLSAERAAVRWIILVVVWLVVGLLAWNEATAVRDYVALLDDSGLLPADSLPMHRPGRVSPLPPIRRARGVSVIRTSTMRPRGGLSTGSPSSFISYRSPD